MNEVFILHQQWPESNEFEIYGIYFSKQHAKKTREKLLAKDSYKYQYLTITRHKVVILNS